MNKETLRQYRDLKAEIQELKQQREDLIYSLSIPSFPYDSGAGDNNSSSAISPNLIRGSGFKSDPTAGTVAKLLGVLEVIDAKIKECTHVCAEIERAIGRLPSRERRILRLRYIKGLSWPRVTLSIYGDRADYLDRCDSYLRTVTNYHRQALRKICT